MFRNSRVGFSVGMCLVKRLVEKILPTGDKRRGRENQRKYVTFGVF